MNNMTSVGFYAMPVNIKMPKTVYILSTLTCSHFLILAWNAEETSLSEIVCSACSFLLLTLHCIVVVSMFLNTFAKTKLDT
jgi:hypothetical protein